MNFELYRIPADHWLAATVRNCSMFVGCGCLILIVVFTPVLAWAIIRLVGAWT